MRALRFRECPTHDLRHVVNVALRHRAVVGKLQGQPRFSLQPQRHFRERLAHRVQVRFRLDPPDGIPVPPGLGHVHVNRDLAQPALHHQPFQKPGMFQQRLPVRHQHRH